MQFFKYWAISDGSVRSSTGEQITRTAYGFSNQSLEDALRVANERATAAARGFGSGQPHSNQTSYYSAAVREEIVEELIDGNRSTIISRNSYGCLVLNTPDVFFADVDLPPAKSAFSQWLASVFRFLNRNKEKSPSFEQQLVEKIHLAVDSNPGIGLRLYRTKFGYRIVVTTQTIDARDSDSLKLLEDLGADKLYVCLCRSQDSYRARLTPKPWRCGINDRPPRYPFLSEAKKTKFFAWVQKYDKQTKRFATCALIGEFGSNSVHPDVQPVLELHDDYVLNEDLPLA